MYQPIFGRPEFTGQFTLSPEKFDFDPSHSPFLQEQLTDFLRTIENLFCAKEYVITFSRSQSVTLTGKK